jgi:hypothetical protein
MVMRAPTRRRAAVSRLFDADKHLVSYHDVSHSQSYRYEDYDIKNTSESITLVSRPRRYFSHFPVGCPLWEYVIFVISILPVCELSFCILFMSDRPTIGFYVVFMICDVVYALDIYVIPRTTYLFTLSRSTIVVESCVTSGSLGWSSMFWPPFLSAGESL